MATLDDLAPPGTDRTTGLVIDWRGRRLFAVEPAPHWRVEDGVPHVRILGLGGHPEPGETWVQAAVREALEEANVRVEIVSSTRTFWCRLSNEVTEIELEWDRSPRPLLVWTAAYTLRRPMREQRFLGLVFAARTDDAPRPGAEVPAVLALTDKQLVAMRHQPVPLAALLGQGATLWEAQAVPRNALIEPGGSAQFYAMLAASPIYCA